MADINPVDFATPLARAQTLVPDWVQQQLQRKLGALQTQNFALQNQRAQQQITEADNQAQNETAFETAISDLGANPTPDRYRALAARFPKFAPGINQAAKGMEDSQRTKTLGDLAQVHSALGANRPELARAIIQRHTDADKAAGREPDPSDAALLAMIDSGDPSQIKAARGFAYSTMNAMEPAVAKNLTEAGAAGGVKGQVVGRAIGHYNDEGVWTTDYRDPEPTEYKSVGAGDTLVAVGGEGGGQASGGAGASGGNSAAPRSVRNNNPGNLKASNFTKSLPGFAGVDSGGFAVFDSPQSGASAQGALLGSYIDRGFNTVDKIINRWAPASDNNDTKAYVATVAKALGVNPGDTLSKAAIPRLQSIISRVEGGPSSSSGGAAGAAMQGGARIVAQGAPKPGYQMLTPEETTSQGLDPNVKYQRAPDGQITALGGQSKAQLKQIPTSAVTSIQENISTGREIDRALTVLKKRPNSIGPGTGSLGDTFTQFNDPEGTDARAAIGKIGGQIIHDVSGAAVTLSEEPRFRPYVPTITDRPSIAIAKLKRLKQLTQSRLDEQKDYYSEPNGYRPYSSGSTNSGGIATVRSIQQAQKLAPGTLYRAPDGKVRRR